ncbi:N-acetylglutamate kinase [Anaeroplasma bactoclasticum]|jgi:acetylglutamate kinase|uniref:Acetylglutamate kinase n=1 Tax=Anaeroplasma bactoclasticum TaxID=2088 RepID=A0A397RVV8_9MOLU|nr:acetylglutamate kinase [Anaeroplasma bactoclasticum]RIA78323.1 N-acetylglutamate kinase [Anaeroplasma bactoclasticum]
MVNLEERAKILSEALPYILKYKDKIMVIKYGGNAMVDENLKRLVMEDVVMLSSLGMKVVLVHGGGPEISAMLKKINKQSEFVNGLRVTDGETMDVVTQVLAGKLNKSLVNQLNLAGGKAIGLSGVDAGMIEALPKDPKLGYVGTITEINTEVILDALTLGYIPVISTIGFDQNGNLYNINADTAAARIAGALDAEKFIAMTDIKGVLKDKDDPTTLMQTINVSEIKQLAKQGIIDGGMLPKVACCEEAIRRGVNNVVIIDGRVPHSILIEVLTDEGVGTQFK